MRDRELLLVLPEHRGMHSVGDRLGLTLPTDQAEADTSETGRSPAEIAP